MIVVGLGVGGLLLSVTLLQSVFDAGDRRRALAALDTTPAGPPGAGSLAEALRGWNGGAPPRCEAQLVSSLRGTTRVTCQVADDPTPFVFRWDDLRRDGLRPEDEATRRRLGRRLGR